MQNKSTPDEDARFDMTAGAVFLLIAIAIVVFSIAIVPDTTLFFILLGLAVFLALFGGWMIYVWRG